MGTNLLAQKIQEEITEYIRTIASKNGKPFDVTRLTQISVSNNICSILFGKRFDYDDQEFKDFMKAIDTVLANQDSSVGALFPFVRHIPGDPFKARKTICDYRVLLDTFIQPIVTRHIQELDGGPNPPDDFITAYLRRVRQDEADQKVSYITEEGRRVCLGESLARMELFLYLAAMIQQFRFLPPEDVCGLPFEYACYGV
nr:hypothetical protein BaRGS_017079 [Batillaria attramentaria]